MSDFWRSRLDIWCFGIILFGLILSGAGLEGFEGMADTLFRAINYEAAPSFTPIERFSIGLMGALTVAWGVTLFYFIRAAHNNFEGNRVWRQLTNIIVIWYAIDSYISYRTGFMLNIASNSVFALGLLIPLYLNGKMSH